MRKSIGLSGALVLVLMLAGTASALAGGQVPQSFPAKQGFKGRSTRGLVPGVDWSLQSLPKPAGARGAVLNSVCCTSATACVAHRLPAGARRGVVHQPHALYRGRHPEDRGDG